jgi:hypothetical protein
VGLGAVTLLVLWLQRARADAQDAFASRRRSLGLTAFRAQTSLILVLPPSQIIITHHHKTCCNPGFPAIKLAQDRRTQLPQNTTSSPPRSLFQLLTPSLQLVANGHERINNSRPGWAPVSTQHSSRVSAQSQNPLQRANSVLSVTAFSHALPHARHMLVPRLLFLA